MRDLKDYLNDNLSLFIISGIMWLGLISLIIAFAVALAK